ncbi:MAG: Nif11 family protein [Synechococcaceae bacterium WB9_2_112]|nr:Nif11 family protein [Synechococcaceae bacterium WB9_2_112]
MVAMDIAQLDALIQLLRNNPDLSDQVLQAPDQQTRANLLQHLGFSVTTAEAPDKRLLVESLGILD